MSEQREDYQMTLNGMRDILFRQTRLVDGWLYMHSQHRTGNCAFRQGDAEVYRIISTMIHMVGISAHSLLKLTDEVGLQTRDCYPISRSIVETVVNIVFIMAQGREAAERADRHAEQKMFRDLNRSASAAGWTMTLASNVKLSREDEARLSELAAQFTTRKGREKRDWTNESLIERIEVSAAHFPDTSMLLLSVALFNIYRHSSEVLHGTYFSAMHFWGLTTPGREAPRNRKEFLHLLSEHQFSILMSAIFAFTTMLECVSHYANLPQLDEQARRELDRLHELPLIKSALENSNDQKSVGPFTRGSRD